MGEIRKVGFESTHRVLCTGVKRYKMVSFGSVEHDIIGTKCGCVSSVSRLKIDMIM